MHLWVKVNYYIYYCFLLFTFLLASWQEYQGYVYSALYIIVEALFLKQQQQLAYSWNIIFMGKLLLMICLFLNFASQKANYFKGNNGEGKGKVCEEKWYLNLPYVYFYFTSNDAVPQKKITKYRETWPQTHSKDCCTFIFCLMYLRLGSTYTFTLYDLSLDWDKIKYNIYHKV